MRQVQPLRRGARAPSAALLNATRGTMLSGHHPADFQRHVQLLMRAGSNRPKRPPRPPRPQRPSR